MSEQNKIPLKIPQYLSATYRVITPMFIGDGRKQATMVYPQSIKGALRFWWRALAWSDIIDQNNGDEITALQQLHKEESLLFGSLDDKINQVQNNVAIRVEQSKTFSGKETTWPENGNTDSGYLGMGIWESGSRERGNYQAHREGITGTEETNKGIRAYEFTVFLTLNKNTTDKQKEQLLQTLKLFGLVGGLGSRSRRGFGSVQLIRLNDVYHSYFSDIDNYQSTIKQILEPYSHTPLAPYTAISKDTLFACKSDFKNAKAAHAALGKQYKNHRGQPSELRGEKKKVFGLPLTGVDEDARRASPLFFHIFRLGDDSKTGAYGYLALYLPSNIFHKEHQKVDWNLNKTFITTLQENA